MSWSAVFAGAIVGLALLVWFIALGSAIGFSTYDRPEEAGYAPAIWAGGSYIVALFLGALVAGRLGRFVRRREGGLNGVVVWALSLVAILFLIAQGLGTAVGFAQGQEQATMEAAQGAMQGATREQAMWGTWSFVIMLFLALIASYLGGLAGAPKIVAGTEEYRGREPGVAPAPA